MIDGFYKIENIFTREQREKLIEDSQPLFVSGKQLFEYNCANSNTIQNHYALGSQEGFKWFRITYPTLHLHSKFDWAHKIILSKIKKVTGIDYQFGESWMNISNGDNKLRLWHNHGEYDYVGVYYLKMFPFFSNGTLFKNHGLVKAKENSLLLFPSHMDHSTPSSPLRFKRYSWAMNLNIKKDLVNGSNE